MPRESIEAPKVSAYEQIKTSIFFLAVLFLMAMMGAHRRGPFHEDHVGGAAYLPADRAHDLCHMLAL